MVGFCGYRKRLPRSLPSRSDSVRAVVQAKYVRSCAPSVRRTTAATADAAAANVHRCRYSSPRRHHTQHVAGRNGPATGWQQSPRLRRRRRRCRFVGQQQRWRHCRRRTSERRPDVVVTVVGHIAVLPERRRRRSRSGHHVAQPRGHRIPGPSLRYDHYNPYNK